MHVNNITDSNSDSHLFTLRAHVVLTLCYLYWWSFLPLTSAFTLLAHVVLHSVTCTGGLFLPPTTAFTLLPHVVIPLLLALCGGGGGGGCMWQGYIDIYSVWHIKAAGLALP